MTRIASSPHFLGLLPIPSVLRSQLIGSHLLAARHTRCCIDLARGVLHFGSCSADLPFLPDHEIPKDFNRAIQEVGRWQQLFGTEGDDEEAEEEEGS